MRPGGILGAMNSATHPHSADPVARAWNSVKALGYRSERTGPPAAHRTVGDDIHTELGNKAAEGAGIGGAIGGSLAAIAAAIAAVDTTLTFPGIGLVLDGPMGAAIAGAGVGAVVGGLVGALVGWGIPEERVRLGPMSEALPGAATGVRAPD